MSRAVAGECDRHPIQRSEVMLVDSLPRNRMGKVERLKLREMMEQKGEEATAEVGEIFVGRDAFDQRET